MRPGWFSVPTRVLSVLQKNPGSHIRVWPPAPGSCLSARSTAAESDCFWATMWLVKNVSRSPGAKIRPERRCTEQRVCVDTRVARACTSMLGAPVRRHMAAAACWPGEAEAQLRGGGSVAFHCLGRPHPTRPHIHTHSQLTNSIYKHRPSITQAAAESWRRQLLIGQSSSLWLKLLPVIYLSSGPGTGTWTRDRDLDQGQVGQRGGVCVCVWMVWCRQSDPPTPPGLDPPPRSWWFVIKHQIYWQIFVFLSFVRGRKNQLQEVSVDFL